ncbi:hypothetical protein ACFE04_008409 [Oxalis oulophora]
MAIMLSLSKLSVTWKINSEAGVTEIWIRRWNTLPSFNNAPRLMYVEEVFMERHSQVVPRHSNHHHNNLINIREANHLEMSTKKFEDFMKKSFLVGNPQEEIQELQNENNKRGIIVRAEMIRPPRLQEGEGEVYEHRQSRPWGRHNGLKETLCTISHLRLNVEHCFIYKNFFVIKKATNERFEWISFKTNENAKISQLTGRFSVTKAIPEKVLMNLFRILMEEARRLKFNMDEATLLHCSRSKYEREY